MNCRVVFGAALAVLMCWPFGAELQALPRMSMTSGAPCSTCHVNKQGGGMRSEIGWGSMAYTGVWDYEDLGIDWLADMYSHEIVERRVAVGIDARVQMARLGRPQIELDDAGESEIVTPGRSVIPMQIQPYMSVEATDFLKFQGSYAVGPGTFRGELCDTPFAGQSCYFAQAIIDTPSEIPNFRVGMFQPSIGIRHDDHTMLIRHDASRERGAIIPVNYAEPGIEASYQPKYWLRMEAGGFLANQLSESTGNPDAVSSMDPAYLGRVSWLPHFDIGERSYFATVGASGYGAGQFHMQNVFAGAGLMDRASLILEAARFTEGSQEEKTGLNLSSVLSVQVKEWLILEGRLERAWAGMEEDEFETRAAVAGVHFYPIPYVKIRPEYRYIRTDQYAMGQYTAQLHLFF